MRVATYNVHSFVGRDRHFDPSRTLAVLQQLNADVVAMQEVLNTERGGQAVLTWLAERLQMTCLTGTTLLRRGTQFGNALLFRGTARTVRRHGISLRGEPRGVIEACLNVGGRELRFLNTHLGLYWRERQRQLFRLAELVSNDTGMPTVLTGDFNEWRPRTRGVRRIEGLLGEGSRPATFPAFLPVWRLDRIWCSVPDCAQASRTLRSPEARHASDHLPLYMDLPANAAS